MSDRNKVTSQQKRPPGRPATGHSPLMYVRVPLETQAAIRDWASRNDVPSLSEAVRMFIEDCLRRDVPKDRLKPLKRTRPAEGS